MHPTKPPITVREPDPSRTRRARVAHSRSGFIVPTASADGDAPPLHDTAPDPHIDRKFSPTGPCPHTPHSVTDETVILGQLGPDDDAPIHQVQASRRPSVAQRRPIAVPARWRRRYRWLPWSVALAGLGFAAVRLAVVVSDQVTSDLAAVATLSMVLCGSLLVAAPNELKGTHARTPTDTPPIEPAHTPSDEATATVDDGSPVQDELPLPSIEPLPTMSDLDALTLDRVRR